MPTKVHLVKAMVFPIVMYGCENWTIKKAEHRRIDAFELWCWRRLLRVPWTARRSNQSILKEINPGCSLEGLMLKLKLQYFGHLMWSADSFEKILMLGKIEGRRRRDDRGWDGWMALSTQWAWIWALGDREGQGSLACCSSWGCKELDTTEWLNNNPFHSNFPHNFSLFRWHTIDINPIIEKLYGMEVKGVSSGVRLPWFKFHLCHVYLLFDLRGNLPLCLLASVAPYKDGMILMPYLEEFYEDCIYRVFRIYTVHEQ